ncbi:DUF1611 domain-containing protein [Natrinema thermotolerans]|uniref:DUF1611 domain-containing protein n=1 Tax=Natrinema thermotolerans TaxID=121872 RepID=A0AAF0T3B9_9EURY|nr:DUF1611 domain-containing protein [Natrinema thermotolerans]QCC58135.1 DUF1611 domain-containing protein [Natrinema thermotolerans]WMT09242.1 DUF1611 domain-containing protein [Natrinema thermotolerans]
MRVAILAHEQFPDRAKTALGVLRYADHDIIAVLDRDSAGRRVSDFVPDVQDAPIVEGMDDLEADAVDALLIGIAPIGGDLEESWRDDIRVALENGYDVISGLHSFLSDDEEFARLAAENDCELRDVRKPPEGLTVAEGVADEVDAEVILTVGTDCSVGKMTTTMELARDARAAGHDAAVVPTGQTGIMIEGWGTPIDRVVSDFTAGAVEEMILEIGDDHDYLFVEGQGSIVHPAYSPVTLGILHGSMADKLVLCHEAGREAIHGYESFALPSIPTYIDLYESVAAPVADGQVVAGALNTSGLADDAAASDAVAEYADALGAPADDVIRFGTDDVLEALL